MGCCTVLLAKQWLGPVSACLPAAPDPFYQCLLNNASTHCPARLPLQMPHAARAAEAGKHLVLSPAQRSPGTSSPAEQHCGEPATVLRGQKHQVRDLRSSRAVSLGSGGAGRSAASQPASLGRLGGGTEDAAPCISQQQRQ